MHPGPRSRQRLTYAIAAVALTVAAVFAFAGPARADVAAYAWPSSVAQGDSVGIYVSTDAPFVSLIIYRRGADFVQMAEYDSLPGINQTVPPSVWSVGCGWRVTKRVPIPANWPSGVYEAYASAPGYGSYYGIFTVREDDPGSTSRI